MNLALAQRVAHIGSWELDLRDETEAAAPTLRWSEESFRILGYDPGSTAASVRKFYEAVHVDDRELVRAAMQRAIAEGDRYSIDHRIVLPDGAIRIVHEEADVICGHGSKDPLKVIGTIQDVTEKKRAEIALRESESRYQSIADNVPGMVYQFILHRDGSTSFPFVSKGAIEVFGVPPEEITGDSQKLLRLIHPDDRGAFERSVAESALTLLPWKWQGRFNRPQGDICWGECVSRPHLLANGDILWDGIVIDLTERKRAEEVLREQAELLNLAHDAIMVREFASRRITFWNAAAEHLYGWTAEEAIGCDIAELISADPEQAEQISEQLIAGG
jgi:PAS domain S-box-containing protein